MRVVGTAVLLAALLAVAGCGSSNTMGTKAINRIKSAMKKTIEQQRAGTHVQYVHCPKNVKKKKGTVFTCQVKAKTRFGTAKGTAVVTETDNRGSVHYVVR
ncbi:MAG: DUF4333 domain-containing protein [Actinobacteria bacterium]|nr:DUF4333 domain-containing protein [Actinomycetota bacterium]